MKKTMRAGMIRSVSVVVAPLIILLVIVNIFSWKMSSLRLEESIRSALKIQAFSLNDMLSETEKSVKSIITNNLQDLLVIKKNSAGLKDFLSKRAVFVQMQNHTGTTDIKDSLFLYSPVSGYLLLNSPEIVGTQRVELCEYLPEIFEREAAGKTEWHLRQVKGRVYAFIWRRASEFYVGGIIPMGELAKIVLDESEDILKNADLIFEDSELRLSVGEDGGIRLTEDALKESFTFSQNIGSSDIELCFAYQSAPFLVPSGIPVLLALMLSVFTLLSMPLLIGRISSRFTKPFYDIQKGMRFVQEGNFQTQIEGSFPYQETEDMRCAFNTMVRQIKILKNDVYEEKLLREKTEANFYQLQVKPHFYLNSLNQIHILAEMGEVEEISQTTLQLTEYFRYLLRSNEQTVVLRDEIRHIENFVSIQKRKYPAGFSFRVEVPPDILLMRIPPLLLLTFAENSIKYATGVYDRLELLLRGEKTEENGCRLIFEDSGPGFGEEVLSVLQEGGKLTALDGHVCIGIANAQQRLRFVYGKNAKIEFCNGGTLKGAHIEIIIPNGKGEWEA